MPTFTYVSPTEVRADFDQPAVYRGTIPNWRINGHPTLFVVGAALGNAQGALITWNGPLAVGYEINVLFGSNSFKAAASGGLTKPGRYVIGA